MLSGTTASDPVDRQAETWITSQTCSDDPLICPGPFSRPGCVGELLWCSWVLIAPGACAAITVTASLLSEEVLAISRLSSVVAAPMRAGGWGRAGGLDPDCCRWAGSEDEEDTDKAEAVEL
jgi:hypothetical protein